MAPVYFDELNMVENIHHHYRDGLIKLTNDVFGVGDCLQIFLKILSKGVLQLLKTDSITKLSEISANVSWNLKVA